MTIRQADRIGANDDNDPYHGYFGQRLRIVAGWSQSAKKSEIWRCRNNLCAGIWDEWTDVGVKMGKDGGRSVARKRWKTATAPVAGSVRRRIGSA
jgi:hypothetical protein